MWMSILLYVLVIYMVFNILRNSKAQKRRQVLIECVNSIKEKDVFFEKVNAIIAGSSEDTNLLNKAYVIKLWGMAYHSEYEEFDATLELLNVDALLTTKKNGQVSIGQNEDSFFYLYLGIPNILYRDHREDLLDHMIEKMQGVNSVLSSQLVYALSVEVNKFYQKEEDLGLAFYQKLLEGNYAEYSYAKSMIGLYKSIANATAARIYLDQNDSAKYQDCEGLLKDFNLSGVGKRWLETLNIVLPEENPVPETTEENSEETPAGDEDKETFRITNESAKNADVIDAEVVKEEEKKEDQE